MPANVYISPVLVFFIFIALWPWRLGPMQLKMLAFALWLVGGVVLLGYGVSRITAPEAGMDNTLLLAGLLLSLLLGWAKGKFVLSKTSDRNIARLEEFTEPRRPIYVYSPRSWIIITVMILIAMSLTWFNAPLFWRGVVNLAVGMALVVSSFRYIGALKPQQG